MLLSEFIVKLGVAIVLTQETLFKTKPDVGNSVKV